ncbi:MAG: YdiU family protein, partial [Proteobacteria bacterium]|nr:YdiU family protein [Pseudomonadota bacterium]
MLALEFDNRFIRELPGDPDTGPGIRQVHGAAWSSVQPSPVEAPLLFAHSAEMAARLGIDEADVATPEFAQVFGGNLLLDGMQPYAANYGGHQFGHWAGQLGDGRAITLGETIARPKGTPEGERWELQLKGAGPTPYSRSADGRAVMRSSIREFLCSEAMHHLGVPTTRALSLVATGEAVVRDMFYDGNARPEPGAVVCRVAPSFIRFGNFELPASRGDTGLLRQLVEFTIDRDFPHLAGKGDGEARYAAWFGEVCERTAVLMGHWMRVGFVHGVMNTDNMSILGLTIDYGPYGWVDNYDPDWTPNTTDAQNRRYRFAQQPAVAYWNLGRLAGALSPLFDGVERLQEGLQRYIDAYTAADRANTAGKLGLVECTEDDLALMQALQDLLVAAEADMTIFFRALAEQFPASGGDIKNAVLKAAAAAANEPGPDAEKRIHQRHFAGAMADVMAAKGVMRQSLFADDAPHAAEQVRARWPEVVAGTPEGAAVGDAGRVQAWVVGPGLGTAGLAAATVEAVLASAVPVLVDAAALTRAAQSPDWLRARSA